MNRCLDYRSDDYSLGVTFFELLTGQLPFRAEDVMGWVHRHKAFSATAFAIAAQSHEAGAACISARDWQARPELCFELCLDRVSSSLMTGRYERALDIQPEHSRHLEQIAGTDLVGKPLALLFHGANLSAAVLPTNESALRFSFGARGRSRVCVRRTTASAPSWRGSRSRRG